MRTTGGSGVGAGAGCGAGGTGSGAVRNSSSRRREEGPAAHRRPGQHERGDGCANAAPRPDRFRDRIDHRVRSRRRHPTIARDAQDRGAAFHDGRELEAHRGSGIEALGGEDDRAIRHGRQFAESGRRDEEQQQRAFRAEAGLQFPPARVRVEVAGTRGIRTRRDEEDAVDLVRSLGQRHAVLEGVDDAVARCQSHGLMERGVLDVQVYQGDAPSAPRGDARDVPGGFRGPHEIGGGEDEGDERLRFDERRDQVPEPRER